MITAEEWDGGKWGYFEELCLEVKVKWPEKTGNVWHSEYLVDKQNVGFIFIFK